eukprot:tig00001477_g8898.t1
MKAAGPSVVVTERAASVELAARSERPSPSTVMAGASSGGSASVGLTASALAQRTVRAGGGGGAGSSPRGSPAFSRFATPVPVDSDQKATTMYFQSVNDVHMRAFYFEAAAIFCAQFAWFGLAPLLSLAYEDVGVPPELRGVVDSVGLIGSVLGSLLLGAATDRLGARLVHGVLLCLCALPTGLVGLASSTESFILCRFLTSWLGASFTVGMAHTSAHFGRSVAGQANGLAGGIGGTGAAAAALIMPQVAYAISNSAGIPLERSWRMASLLPASVVFLAGACLLAFTQDLPQGNVVHLRDVHLRIPLLSHHPADDPERHAAPAAPTPPPGPAGRKAGRVALLRDGRVWAMAGLYAIPTSPGITMNQTLPKYYLRRFGLDIRTAGLLSALCQVQMRGARGRVVVLVALCVAMAGGFVGLALLPRLEAAAAWAVLLSLTYHAAGGAAYSIIPYFGDSLRGAAGGLVSCGGTGGATLLAFLFEAPALAMPDAFLAYAGIALALCCLAPLVRFPDTDELATAPSTSLPALPPAPSAPGPDPALSARLAGASGALELASGAVVIPLGAYGASLEGSRRGRAPGAEAGRPACVCTCDMLPGAVEEGGAACPRCRLPFSPV